MEGGGKTSKWRTKRLEVWYLAFPPKHNPQSCFPFFGPCFPVGRNRGRGSPGLTRAGLVADDFEFLHLPVIIDYIFDYVVTISLFIPKPYGFDHVEWIRRAMPSHAFVFVFPSLRLIRVTIHSWSTLSCCQTYRRSHPAVQKDPQRAFFRAWGTRRISIIIFNHS